MGIQIRMDKRARYWADVACGPWMLLEDRQKMSVKYIYAYTLYWIELNWLNWKPEWNRCSAIWEERRVAFVSAEKLLKIRYAPNCFLCNKWGFMPSPPGSAIALSKFYRDLRCSHHTNNPIICHRFRMMWSIKLVQLFRGCCKSVIYTEIFFKGFWLSDSNLIIFEVTQFWKQILPSESMWKGKQKT